MEWRVVPLLSPPVHSIIPVFSIETEWKHVSHILHRERIDIYWPQLRRVFSIHGYSYRKLKGQLSERRVLLKGCFCWDNFFLIALLHFNLSIITVSGPGEFSRV